MNKPRRLLVRGVNWLGDAIMSTPALVRLREALPETHIALLTADKLAELWQNHPSINEVVSFTPRHGVGYVSRLLRAGKYDSALILPNSFRSAFESWLAGIPIRVGYARPLLLTERVRPRAEHIEMRKRTVAEIRKLVRKVPRAHREEYPSAAHHLHQYLRLASFFGANEHPVPPVIPIRSTEIESLTQKFNIAQDKLRIGLNPGAEYGPAKRWPAENFIEAALKVTAANDVHWLIFGGRGDFETATVIERTISARGAHVTNLAGRTSLRELAIGLASCQAVVTNDTGPMHLAAAVGTHVVVPFGSTSPELTAPGLPGDTAHSLLLGDVPCAPCFLRECPIDFRCMRSITPDAVARAVVRLIRGRDC